MNCGSVGIDAIGVQLALLGVDAGWCSSRRVEGVQPRPIAARVTERDRRAPRVSPKAVDPEVAIHARGDAVLVDDGALQVAENSASASVSAHDAAGRAQRRACSG